MSVHLTYFVHGTTTDNEQKISSGWKDVGLSDLGVQQSKALRETVKDKKFDAVFCSDLKRAVQSAAIAFSGLAPIIPDARLRERNYGKYNGQPSAIVEPLESKYIAEPFPDGESFEEVKKRMADWLEFLKKNYRGKKVAALAHKAPQLALEVLLKNKTWPQALAEDWRKTRAWQAGWEYEC